MAPRVIPLPDILNDVQNSVATHRKYVRELAPRRRAAPEALAQELMSLLRHALVVSKVRARGCSTSLLRPLTRALLPALSCCTARACCGAPCALCGRPCHRTRR